MAWFQPERRSRHRPDPAKKTQSSTRPRTSCSSRAATTVNGNPFADAINAFTKEGTVAFTAPPGLARFTVNGKQSFWLRVRIIAENYGVEGHYVARAVLPGTATNPFDFSLPTFQPPSISSITVQYDVDKPGLTQSPAIPDT